jgi:hypothetical protein
VVPKVARSAEISTLVLHTFVHKDYVAVSTGGYNPFDSKP